MGGGSEVLVIRCVQPSADRRQNDDPVLPESRPSSSAVRGDI